MGKVTKLNLDSSHVSANARLHLRDIHDENPEPRGTTGAQMHAARLAMGEDIPAVASRLRIRRDQIEAIEGGDFQKLPGRAYSIGFVRSYAEYLGLNETEVVTAFKAEFDAAMLPGSELHFPDVEEDTRLPRGAVIVIAVVALAALYGVWTLTVSADRMVEERASAPSVAPATRVVAPPKAPETLAATPAENIDRTASEASAVVLPAAGEPAASSLNTDGDVAAAPSENATDAGGVTAENAVTPETAPQAVATDTETQTAAIKPAEESGGDQLSPLETGAERAWEGFVYGQQNHDSRVFIRANAQTWVRVEDADGNVLLSRTLRAGESYRAPNRPGMVLATRNAGALQLFVDGKPAGTAGAPGQPLVDKPLDPAALSGQ